MLELVELGVTIGGEIVKEIGMGGTKAKMSGLLFGLSATKEFLGNGPIHGDSNGGEATEAEQGGPRTVPEYSLSFW